MAKPTPPYDYQVGDWVRFGHIAEQRRDPSRDRHGGQYRAHMPRRLVEAAEGQIVGAVRAFNGLYLPGHFHEDGDDLPSLNSREGVLLWEVRVGMQNAPVRVLPEHLVRIEVHKLRRLPWRTRVPRRAGVEA